ncbi:MAG: hypothetical protein R6W92_15555 [Desulfocurvibacter africanus]
MIELTREAVEAYLRQAFGPDAALTYMGDIGGLGEQGIKRFGYGKPMLVRFTLGGREQATVMSVMKADKYGHQFYWDRAAILMFQHETSARLPRHVRPMGLGYVDGRDCLVPVHEPKEFFILNELLPGHEYFRDLERIRERGIEERDMELARAFARWLAEIHATAGCMPTTTVSASIIRVMDAMLLSMRPMKESTISRAEMSMSTPCAPLVPTMRVKSSWSVMARRSCMST